MKSKLKNVQINLTKQSVILSSMYFCQVLLVFTTVILISVSFLKLLQESRWHPINAGLSNMWI